MDSLNSRFLCHDILWLVFQFLDGDDDTLYHCSLVSRSFNRAASRVLYRKVVISPPQYYGPIHLRENQGALLKSSSSPRNAQHVLKLEISGYISELPPNSNPFGRQLLAALQTYCNLYSVNFTPTTYHRDLFTTEILQFLVGLPRLQHLTVNASCMDKRRAPIIAKITGLRRLGLSNPTRAILQLLPEWLSRLSNTLTELHLTDNCGSVTPGVLKSFLPHVREIDTFTLGLSYSLTNQDVFSFLGELTCLESLKLRYYPQLKPLEVVPAFPNLVAFSVIHPFADKREDVNRLCTWIRRVIASSPLLLLLGIIACDEPENIRTGANIAFDSIISHLGRKHADTLEYLVMPRCFVRTEALRFLCQTCVNLEQLSISVDKDVLSTFGEIAADMDYLHTVAFEIRNIKRRRVRLDAEKASEIMKNGPPSLTRLSVNGTWWEAD